MKFKKAASFAAGIILSIILSSTNVLAADYKVVRTDTLYKISVLFNTPVEEIKIDNHLTSNMIYPGKILQIPAKLYTVKYGDTLYLIAKRYGITIASIKKANHKKNNLLIPGKQIILPGINPITGQTSSIQNTKALSSNMLSQTTESSKTVIPYTKEEVDLLARLISAEASGQPYNAMVAVGAVVVNRVQSKEWPSTISGVINHVSGGYYQFTPVKNGYIKNPATDIAIKAAWDALYGKDPSNGAMFYFDDSSKNQWLWSKPLAARIGSMVFVY